MGSEVLLRLSINQANALVWLTEAASKDQARPTVCSVNFEWKVIDKDVLEVTAAATDSYMLATRTMIFEKGTYEAAPAEGSVLIQAKPLAVALKSTVKAGKDYALPEMQDSILQLEDDGAMVGSADGSEFKSVKMVDAKFPKWRSLVPDKPVRKFSLADMKEAGNKRKPEEKREDFYFELPAVSPALMLRATKIVGQPASVLGKGQPLRWAVSDINRAHLKPSMFTMPNGKGNFGDLMILVMPVRM